MPEYLVAIDLGTSNCCLSYANIENKEVKVLDFGGKNIYPSVLYYKPDGAYDAGWSAALRYRRNDGVVNYMKRVLAKKYKDIPKQVKDSCKSEVVSGPKGFAAFKVNGSTKLPEDVLTDLVRSMRDHFIEKCRGDGDGDGDRETVVNVKKVIVTIPSNYVQDPIVYTKRIIKNAGFNCEVTTIPEPVAACMAYNVSDMTDSGYFMVFDIGGGTCDVALLSLNGSRFDVKDHVGNDIAGAVFDNLIREWVGQQIQERLGISITLPDDDPRKQLAEKILLDICREAKEQLSSLESIDIELVPYFEKINTENIRRKSKTSSDDEFDDFNDSDDSDNDDDDDRRGIIWDSTCTLSREELNKIIETPINECINLISLILTRNGLTPEDITKIILVGGSSRLCLIESRIMSIFGTGKICHTINPDECVSRGACGFGVSGASFTDCLHHNIYHCVGRPDNPKNYVVLLNEHESLPCSATHQCKIRHDRTLPYYRDVIYQGIKPQGATQLAPMLVSGYTFDPVNDVTVTYTIKINEERILSYSVKDDTTGKVLVEDSVVSFT